MPYCDKEKKLFAGLVKKHKGRAREVYHAMLNSGKYNHLFCSKSLSKRNKK